MHGKIVKIEKVLKNVNPYVEAATRGKIRIVLCPLNPKIKPHLKEIIPKYFSQWHPTDLSVLESEDSCFDALQRYYMHINVDRQLDFQGVPEGSRQIYHEDVEAFCDQLNQC